MSYIKMGWCAKGLETFWSQYLKIKNWWQIYLEIYIKGGQILVTVEQVMIVLEISFMLITW